MHVALSDEAYAYVDKRGIPASDEGALCSLCDVQHQQWDQTTAVVV